MPTVYKTVDVDVEIDIDLDDFDDDDLVEELEYRGFHVSEKDPLDIQDQHGDVIYTVAWLLDLNKTEEALIQLERMFPSLKGMKDKIRTAGVV